MTQQTLLAGLAVLGMLGADRLLLSTQPAAARAITVAAASDLQTVLPEVAARFEPQARVRISFGSSGNFFAQIQNGAPFDVFMSADIDYPKQLVANGLADGDSLYQYATGRIVLWTRKDSGIDVGGGLPILQNARVKRIAIANPQHAPYGRAAVAALKSARVYGTVQRKLVLGENISQTAQLVDSGNAEVGIVALALALGPALSASGTYNEIPATAHPPLDQATVVLSASTNKDVARRFIDFLKRSETIQLLQRFGFAPPPGVAR